jgi:flagellar hook-associated protein 1 FlgK
VSLYSLLGIARSALLAHQRAMNVTSHNIANAQTPGYSRQRLELTAETVPYPLIGTLGRGVSAETLTRVRDRLLDSGYRRQSALLGGADLRHDVLSQVEAAIGEPSDLGVSAALDRLFQSFADLADDPSGATSRELVRQNARRFIQQVRHLDSRLDEIAADALTRLGEQVGEVNGLLRQVAEINRQVLSGGGSAPDLEDQRDRVIDQLSGFLGVQAQLREDGTIAVTSHGVSLVDGVHVETLEMQAAPGGGYALATSSGTPLTVTEGSLASLLEMLGTALPDLSDRLDTFVRSLVTEVNNVHRGGYTLDGLRNRNFFDPNGLTAGTIALDAGIEASGNGIAAALTQSPGDGGNAQLMLELNGSQLASLGGRSFREYYMEMASSVGIGVQNSGQDVEIQQILVDRAEDLRSAVSGVSLDEEMVLLIAQQQAYQAAARLIRVADDMMQDLMNLL